jgi:hypothetical protein
MSCGVFIITETRLIMKRGFLFGLGSFLIVAAVAGLTGAILRKVGLASAIVGLICNPLSAVVIRAARLAPSHRSLLYAVVGWVVGFFAIDAVIFAAIAVAILVPLLAK